MPRIRTIKPEFWEDEKIGRLTHSARLLFIACLNLADDEGLLRWNVMYLNSSVFPYDKLSVESVKKLMAEIVDERLIFPYRGGVGVYDLAYIINFKKHQKINNPSLPRLPPPSLNNLEVRMMYARRDGFRCHICGSIIDVSRGTLFSGHADLLSIDHLIAKKNGGSDYPSNIKVAHFGCNSSKGMKNVDNGVNNQNSENTYNIDIQNTDESYYSSDSVNPTIRNRKGIGKEGEGKGREVQTAPPHENFIENEKGHFKAQYAPEIMPAVSEPALPGEVPKKPPRNGLPTILECGQFFAEQSKYFWDATYCQQQTTLFFNHYEAIGWKVSNRIVTNWEALIISWITRQIGFDGEKQKKKSTKGVEKVTVLMGDLSTQVEFLYAEFLAGRDHTLQANGQHYKFLMDSKDIVLSAADQQELNDCACEQRYKSLIHSAERSHQHMAYWYDLRNLDHPELKPDRNQFYLAVKRCAITLIFQRLQAAGKTTIL